MLQPGGPTVSSPALYDASGRLAPRLPASGEVTRRVEEVLLATGDLLLRPDHITEDNVPPAWRYYDIYMRIRAVLVEGQEPADTHPSHRGDPTF